MSYRVKEKGYKLKYNENAVIAHYQPETIRRFLKQQFQHACWRIKLYKDHPNMMKGDDYSSFFDHIQPPMFLGIFFLIPFIWINIVTIIIFFLCFISLLMQIPLAYKIVRRTSDNKYFFIIFLMFLRGFVRGAGMLKGIMKFGMIYPF